MNMDVRYIVRLTNAFEKLATDPKDPESRPTIPIPETTGREIAGLPAKPIQPSPRTFQEGGMGWVHIALPRIYFDKLANWNVGRTLDLAAHMADMLIEYIEYSDLPEDKREQIKQEAYIFIGELKEIQPALEACGQAVKKASKSI